MLDALSEETQRLESIYRQKLAALGEFKKSLLHEAFNGRLYRTQSPDCTVKMNEAETRAELIDPALKAAGWGVVEGSRIQREYPITLGRLEGFGRRGKPLIADYVLVYRNHKLAVIEAKAWDESLTEGVAQAKNYADKLAVRFAYSTNGRDIYGIDMADGKEGILAAIPTPEDLWNRTFAEENAWRDRFAAVPFEDKGGYFQGRYYQDLRH